MDVGAILYGLISETADLLEVLHATNFRVYTEWYQKPKHIL